VTREAQDRLVIADDAPRTGVLVLRVWLELDAAGLRARVTEVDDLSAGHETTRVSADIEEILDWVRAFLQRFLA
jgi:hypothetical protein